MKTSKTSNKLIAATLSALTVSSILPMHAHAKDAIGPGDSDSTWVVGAAAGAFKNPYIGEDEETWISPTVRYNGERVFYKDGSLNIHITKSNGFSAGLKFAVDGGFLFDEDNYRDNPRLSGLNERDATILGGIYCGMSFRRRKRMATTTQQWYYHHPRRQRNSPSFASQSSNSPCTRKSLTRDTLCTTSNGSSDGWS